MIMRLMCLLVLVMQSVAMNAGDKSIKKSASGPQRSLSASTIMSQPGGLSHIDSDAFGPKPPHRHKKHVHHVHYESDDVDEEYEKLRRNWMFARDEFLELQGRVIQAEEADSSWSSAVGYTLTITTLSALAGSIGGYLASSYNEHENRRNAVRGAWAGGGMGATCSAGINAVSSYIKKKELRALRKKRDDASKKTTELENKAKEHKKQS